MAGLIEAGMEAGLIRDGAVAASEAQRATIWALREALPQANRRIGAISSHDISLPLSAISRFIPQAGAALAKLGDMRILSLIHI